MTELLSDPARRFQEMTSGHHPLCRDEVVWMLEYIHKKMAEKDSGLLELSPPRLLRNYYYFAEIVMLFLRRNAEHHFEPGQVKEWLKEASYGLWPEDN